MKQALETQLTSGPLADLTSGAANGNGFVQEVQSLETSYEQNLDQQLSPAFPNIDQILKLAGQAVVADVVSLNQQSSVGLISSSTLATEATTAINSLTQGPIHSLGTPLSGYSSATQSFESDLNTLAQSLSSSATTPLTSAQVSTTALAEAEAYRATLHAGLQVTHPFVSNMVDSAVNALETTANSIASDDSSTAQTQLNTCDQRVRHGAAGHDRSLRSPRGDQLGARKSSQLHTQPDRPAGRLLDQQRSRHSGRGRDRDPDRHAHLAGDQPRYRRQDDQLHVGRSLCRPGRN